MAWRGTGVSAFEFSFGLLSLLLGLGFAHLADVVAKLALSERPVRWDWLSPMVALNVFLQGLVYWWFQWTLREQPVQLMDLTARAAACLALYMLAVAALPAVRDEPVDMRQHFERSRRFVYATLIVYILLVSYLLPAIAGRGLSRDPFDAAQVALAVVGMFVSARWLHAGVQLFLLLPMAQYWMLSTIRG